ncbi:MAG: hypothetical protein QJR14_03205 [Bacillota bacterium]|nr:hypothetical protein [Bacillota bacterium]
MSDRRRVEALVGAAGTGKSHRATQLAYDLGCPLLLDDGLLIERERIVAGRSAKRAPNLIAAVRTAILSDPAHRAEVRAALDARPGVPLLVIGTSEAMVERICAALDLALPARMRRIEELASEEEIRQALGERQSTGRHVIPAPTLEVRRSFPGYLIDPVVLFLRLRRHGTAWVERSVVRPTYSRLGHFSISRHALRSLAAYEARQVPGVREVLRCRVEQRSGRIELALELELVYGHRLHHVLRQVQERVATRVEQLTALLIGGVEVSAARLTLPSRAVPPETQPPAPQPPAPEPSDPRPPGSREEGGIER